MTSHERLVQSSKELKRVYAVLHDFARDLYVFEGLGARGLGLKVFRV